MKFDYTLRNHNIGEMSKLGLQSNEILELKKNSTPEKALQQIREKRYARALDGYTGQKFAVGIAYDQEQKVHKVKFEDL